MSNYQSIFMLIRYIGENITLFSSGLFSGAVLYICLTERPPRTLLTFADLLALSRANATRTNALLAFLAGLSGIASLLTYYTGGGLSWLAGGVAHLFALALLLSELPRISKGLHDLSGETEAEPEGRRLMSRETAYFSALCMLGLASQYFFIAQPL